MANDLLRRFRSDESRRFFPGRSSLQRLANRIDPLCSQNQLSLLPAIQSYQNGLQYPQYPVSRDFPDGYDAHFVHALFFFFGI